MAERSAPAPDWSASTVVVEAPGDGPGHWAGAPSAVVHDGVVHLAYRLRRPVGEGRGYANVVARSVDGVHFETVTLLHREEFGAESLERPALVRLPDGGWRIYVSSDRPAEGGWQIDVVDADDPAGFRAADRVPMVLPGATRSLKDPVVLRVGDRWHAWVCCHADSGSPHSDAAYTVSATSDDGVRWVSLGPALLPRAGSWDARLARVAAVVLDGGSTTAFYDGRASAAENYEERTGLAIGTGTGPFEAQDGTAAAVSPFGTRSLRYVALVPDPAGGVRYYFEATREDGAHELRTQHVRVP